MERGKPFWHTLLPNGKPLHLDNDLSLLLSTSPLIHTVVIGCGMTSLSSLITLSTHLPPDELISLDACGISDSATGRNGGHQFMEVAGGKGDGRRRC